MHGVEYLKGTSKICCYWKPSVTLQKGARWANKESNSSTFYLISLQKADQRRILASSNGIGSTQFWDDPLQSSLLLRELPVRLFHFLLAGFSLLKCFCEFRVFDVEFLHKMSWTRCTDLRLLKLQRKEKHEEKTHYVHCNKETTRKFRTYVLVFNPQN